MLTIGRNRVVSGFTFSIRSTPMLTCAKGINFNPTLEITSVRDLNALLQFGDLRLKMRQMMRLPQLGPEYLFLNLQNPSLGPGRPNLLQ